MIGFGTREFSDLMLPLSDEYLEQVKPFWLEGEEIFKTFRNDESVVFFTNFRMLFVRIPMPGFALIKDKTWSAIHYQNIISYDVLTMDSIDYGKMELKFTDETVYGFVFSDFEDAIATSKRIATILISKTKN